MRLDGFETKVEGPSLQNSCFPFIQIFVFFLPGMKFNSFLHHEFDFQPYVLLRRDLIAEYSLIYLLPNNEEEDGDFESFSIPVKDDHV